MIDRNSLINDSETAIRTALDGRQALIWTAMPAIVKSVNFDAMTIEAEITVMGETTNPDGTTNQVAIFPCPDIPICFPSAGGFTLTLPIAVGDEVLLVFASRCIDGWWELGDVQAAPEFRMHDLSDAFAIPGPKSQPNVIANISSTNAQLRSHSGNVYLEITPSGAINLVAPAGVTVTGMLTVDGGLTFDGNLAVTGSITATGEVTGKGIPLSSHTHTSGEPGSPTSGPIA
jgi:hypothetical protein